MPIDDPENPTLRGAIWNVQNLGSELLGRGGSDDFQIKIRFILNYIHQERLDFAVLSECGREVIEYFNEIYLNQRRRVPVIGNFQVVAWTEESGTVVTYYILVSELTQTEKFLIVYKPRLQIRDFTTFGSIDISGLTPGSIRQGLFFRIEYDDISVAVGVVHAPSASTIKIDNTSQNNLPGRINYLNQRIMEFELKCSEFGDSIKLLGGDFNFKCDELDHLGETFLNHQFHPIVPWYDEEDQLIYPSTSLRKFSTIIRQNRVVDCLSQPYDQLWGWSEIDSWYTCVLPSIPSNIPYGTVLTRSIDKFDERLVFPISDLVFGTKNSPNSILSYPSKQELKVVFRDHFLRAVQKNYTRMGLASIDYNDLNTEEQWIYDNIEGELVFLESLISQLFVGQTDEFKIQSPLYLFMIFVRVCLENLGNIPPVFWPLNFFSNSKKNIFATNYKIIPAIIALHQFHGIDREIASLAAYENTISDHLPLHFEINITTLQQLIYSSEAGDENRGVKRTRVNEEESGAGDEGTDSGTGAGLTDGSQPPNANETSQNTFLAT